jgi:hypothetical protein
VAQHTTTAIIQRGLMVKRIDFPTFKLMNQLGMISSRSFHTPTSPQRGFQSSLPRSPTRAKRTGEANSIQDRWRAFEKRQD